MKSEQRNGYLILGTMELDFKIPTTASLCGWCRLANWTGSPCSDPDLECEHLLDIVSENCMNVWQGDDCWGFRPLVAREDAVDICGLALQGKWVDWQTVPLLTRRRG